MNLSENRGKELKPFSERKYCAPSCPFFKCERRALRVVSKRHMCTLTADLCEPRNCNFVICVMNKYLPGGICGKDIKRVTRPVKVYKEPEVSKDRIRGKLKEFKDEFL